MFFFSHFFLLLLRVVGKLSNVVGGRTVKKSVGLTSMESTYKTNNEEEMLHLHGARETSWNTLIYLLTYFWSTHSVFSD